MTNEQIIEKALLAAFQLVEESGEKLTQEEIILRVEQHARAVLAAFYGD